MRELFERAGLVGPLPRAEAATRVTLPSQVINVAQMVRPKGTTDNRRMRRDWKTLLKLSESPLPARAITLIADKLTSLEYRVAPKPTLEAAGKDYSKQIDIVQSVIDKPNIEDEDWPTFKRAIHEDQMVFDFGSWEYVDHPTPAPSTRNTLLALIPIPGWSIERVVGWSGEVDKPRWAQVGPDKKIPLLDSQIEAIIMRNRTSTSYGLSPMETVVGLMDAYLKLTSYQASVASEAYPAFMISLGEEVEQTDVDQMKLYWNNDMMGQGRPGVIGGFKDPKTVQMKPISDEGLYLKYWEILVRVLSFCFGLKPQDFNITHDVNKNQGQINQAASIEEAIRPYAIKFANRFNSRVMPRIALLAGDPKILDLEYSYSNIDPWDEKEQTDIAVKLWTSNAITHDEMLERIGEDAAEDGTGDMYYAELTSMFAPVAPPPQDSADDGSGDGKDSQSKNAARSFSAAKKKR